MNAITMRPPVAAAKADRSYWLRSIEADAVTRPLQGAADCDDGVFCNGVERCVSGACEAPLAVAHQDQFPAATLSFDIAPGASLGDAGAPLFPHEYVVRLEVTMSEPHCMRSSQPLACFQVHKQQVLPRARTLSLPLCQGFSFHKFHCDEDLGMKLTNFKYRYNIRIRDARHRLGLTQDALFLHVVGGLGMLK